MQKINEFSDYKDSLKIYNRVIDVYFYKDSLSDYIVITDNLVYEKNNFSGYKIVKSRLVSFYDISKSFSKYINALDVIKEYPLKYTAKEDIENKLPPYRNSIQKYEILNNGNLKKVEMNGNEDLLIWNIKPIELDSISNN